MAVITITEILGGDNIAGSRITINDNFKRVANAINTLETRLDTSFTPGGSLNVGNALIRRYTNPTTTQIFNCEATGLFQGNLNVLLDLGISQSTSVGLDLTVNRNVTFSGAAIGGPWEFTSQVRSTFENEIVNEQLNGATVIAPALNPQPPTAGTTRVISSVIGYSVLRILTDTYAGVLGVSDADTIQLPIVGVGATPGQILTIILDGTLPSGTPMSGGLKITNINNAFAPGAVTTQLVMGAVTATNSADIRKLAVTLFADAAGWRVLNITQSTGVIDITY
jgi:hypothetical protein